MIHLPDTQTCPPSARHKSGMQWNKTICKLGFKLNRREEGTKNKISNISKGNERAVVQDPKGENEKQSMTDWGGKCKQKYVAQSKS